ncbi:thioredoxin-like protein [Xylariaceae sp. FL1272]|nr:thioredoxin-like protein [Xylariaceae sp. FL1272]
MAPNKITLYVDVVSPFAYEAFYLLQNDPVFQDVQVTYVPIFLGGLMKLCGNVAPISIKNKDKWIFQERLRWATHFNIPMAHDTPPKFPPVTLHPMRALSCVEDQGKLVKLLARFWDDFFVHHKPIAERDVFEGVFRDILGEEEGGRAIAEAATKGKATLLANTDRAFAAGAFGIPWFECTNGQGETDSFWGVDHLGQVIRFLGLRVPDTWHASASSAAGQSHTSVGWKAVL